MDILGQTVNHKRFGKGVVTDFYENKIMVRFSESKKLFPFPDAIPRYLTLKNTSMQKKLERINEEREQVINEKRRKIEKENSYQSRLYALKILPKSQIAYNVTEEDITELKHVETGCFLSGHMKGKPRVPTNVQPNSAVIFTHCSSDNEEERMIIGAAMVDERLWGEDCKDGIIKLHEKHKLALPVGQRISFWEYFSCEAFPKRWGKVPFKYFQNQTMERILLDICQNLEKTKQEKDAMEIYHYFCKLNRIPEKRK